MIETIESEFAELTANRTNTTSSAAHCRFCKAPLTHTFVDLGMSPLCESYLAADQLNRMEPFYPLHVKVCEQCYLVQLEEYVSPEHIFTEYAYFSSYSDSWLKHASNYVEMISERFHLGAHSLAVELASNDGYLLQYFVEKGVPVLPDLNDFVGGIRIVLKPGGVATLEFPHLERLMEENQYDTIYHEHFSYFSLITVEKIFKGHGLVLFDVDEIPTHGGSLRIYLRHAEDNSKGVTPAVVSLREREVAFGLDRMETYANFGEQVKESKRALLELLIRLRRNGKRIAGYGAPGKG